MVDTGMWAAMAADGVFWEAWPTEHSEMGRPLMGGELRPWTGGGDDGRISWGVDGGARGV